MEVTSGASWSTTSGLRQWSVALNENDGAQLNPKWEELSWNQKKSFLQKSADILVVQYLREQHALSEELFAQRLKEIRES